MEIMENQTKIYLVEFENGTNTKIRVPISNEKLDVEDVLLGLGYSSRMVANAKIESGQYLG